MRTILFAPENTIPPALAQFAPGARKTAIDPTQNNWIEGRNGLCIGIPANSLEVPAACEGRTVDAYLTDFVSPLETVAANWNFEVSSAVQNEGVEEAAPMLLESAGMFDLRIECEGSPVALQEGKSISIQKPNTVQGSEFGMYRSVGDAWVADGSRKADTSRPVYRGNLVAPSQASVEVVDFKSGQWLDSVRPGSISVFDNSSSGWVWLTQMGSVPVLYRLESADGSGIVRTKAVALKLLPPEAMDRNALTEVAQIKIPEELKTADCAARVMVVRISTGRIMNPRAILNEQVIPAGNGYICINEEQMQSASTLEFLRPQSSKSKDRFRISIEPQDRGTIRILAGESLMDDSNVEEAISVSGRNFAMLRSLGAWNFDYPRTDLACLEVHVQNVQGTYMASVISLDRFSAYTLNGASTTMRTAFLQGERSKVLIFSKETNQYGLSREFTVWDKYGHFKFADSPCQNLDPIELKPLPTFAMTDPDRFRRTLGL